MSKIASPGPPGRPDAWPTDQNEVNMFLDQLREDGTTNMFGAGPYVQDEFGLTKREADKMLGEWMRTFSERHPS